MMRALLILACIGLTGCGALSSVTGSIGSLSLGGTRSSGAKTRADLPALIPGGAAHTLEARQIAASISKAELTPTPQGALLRVEARPRTPGAYNAELVLTGQSAATLRFELRLQTAANPTAQPRQITVARALTRRELAGIRHIEIRGAGGITTLRR